MTASLTVAALYVQADGCYVGLSGVDPWDEARDARTYAGPHPVVAHPPCARWGRFWWAARHRGLGIGDDGGCFAAALAAVHAWGGVLEHPEGSFAWARFGLPTPRRGHGWTRGLFGAGMSCCVDQAAWGHRARKRTWLYYAGRLDPPLVDHGRCGPQTAWLTLPRAATSTRRAIQKQRRVYVMSGPGKSATAEARRIHGITLMGKRERAATPPAFRDLLLGLARGCGGPP